MARSTQRLNQQWFWFKMSQEKGPQHKVSSDRLVKPLTQESNSGPLGTRQVTYPLHHAGSRFVCIFILCGEHPKAQPTVVLDLPGYPLLQLQVYMKFINSGNIIPQQNF